MNAMSGFALAGIVWLAVAPLGGCASALQPQAVLTLEVAAHTVACTGEAPQRCLLVRREPTDEWSNFYDHIEGFVYEEGYRWRIEVERRRVPNPASDASSYAYRLLRVLSKERSQ
jgi:hypothetical protein